MYRNRLSGRDIPDRAPPRCWPGPTCYRSGGPPSIICEHRRQGVNRPRGQSTEKLVPQPHADLAFGFRTAKWLPIRASV